MDFEPTLSSRFVADTSNALLFDILTKALETYYASSSLHTGFIEAVSRVVPLPVKTMSSYVNTK